MLELMKFAMGWPKTISGEKMDTRIEKQNLPHSKLEKEEDILEKICLCKQNCRSGCVQNRTHCNRWVGEGNVSVYQFRKYVLWKTNQEFRTYRSLWKRKVYLYDADV